ncbi:MAG: polyprenyl synthetase family protein [Candidatus Eremiobacteraeota bacterium]|nr:polyprenyl synthetase family protein [Candidatus Eremiobacteraeota bacterium]MBC5826475.1 polyprenyl synthetase family protein [Candidatus Eremiobacteraeota bacterium]
MAKISAGADLGDCFERYLQSFLREQSTSSAVYGQIHRHFGCGSDGILRRGKRLRPAMLGAAARSLGAPLSATLAAAAAIELLHNYSLIHDDIEDGDRLRHGRETLWCQFGLAHGINAGDAVGSLAQLALEPAGKELGFEAAFAMSMELAQANRRMCEGQALDLELEVAEPRSVTIQTYMTMIEGKTAALFRCAAMLGALCAAADHDDLRRCSDIGRVFGLGFQIDDDIAGCWGSAEETGKIPASDIARRKKTYPIVWTMERGPRDAARIVADACRRQQTPLDEAASREVLDALASAGAQSAAREAANSYFTQALERAEKFPPLARFIQPWHKA